jgi:hypothetical protein
MDFKADASFATWCPLCADRSFAANEASDTCRRYEDDIGRNPPRLGAPGDGI